MISNIPKELQQLNQWVCFDLVDGKKVPFIPGTNSNASSNRPKDWRSFRQALADVKEGVRQHVGFCFSSSDPYVFIDLDEPGDPEQKEVYLRLKTYSQRSISGTGIHIIAKGTFKGQGKHPTKPHAGIFKECRFCLMTGDILRKRTEIKEIPEKDLQAIHRWLGGSSGDVGYGDFELVEYERELPEQTVVDMGIARFGKKFDDLCSGHWQRYKEYGGDHSKADHAFISMLCDLTESNEQVRWIFKSSGMWNDERASKKSGHGEDGYVDRTIKKTRGKQEKRRLVNEKVKIQLSAEERELPVLTEKPSNAPVEIVKGKNDMIESMPAGLLKEIARYSFQTSYYALQEASLAVALTVMSGLCGRGYQTPTKSGLNLWVILVGNTSCGKDEFQQGIKRVSGALSKRIPHVRRIFGGELVSGPAIQTVFSDTYRFVSYFPEFGAAFHALANPNGPEHQRTLSRGLLNSFNSAGIGGTLEARKKAERSDEPQSIERPCLCVVGESTPGNLYGGMTTGELDSGFLQRFILLNVPESSWSLEENEKYGAVPREKLLDHIEQLALLMDKLDVENKAHIVEISDEAKEIWSTYRRELRRANMTQGLGEAQQEINNRAALKALRIATLLAIGKDIHKPYIETQHVRWAIDFISGRDNELIEKFASGEASGGQVRQESEILKAFKEIAGLSKNKRIALHMSKDMALEKSLCPYSILKGRVTTLPAFSNDRLGAVTAFDKSIENLIRSGQIMKVDPDVASEDYDYLAGTLLRLMAK